MTERRAWAGPAGAHADAVHSAMRRVMLHLPNVRSVGMCVNGDSPGCTASAVIGPHDGGEPSTFTLGIGENCGDHCDALMPLDLADPPEATAVAAVERILDCTGAAGDQTDVAKMALAEHFPFTVH